MNLFDAKDHLTQDALQSLHDGTLPVEDKFICLDHMAECDACSLKYALLIGEDDFAAMPEVLPEDTVSIMRYVSGEKYMLRYKLKVIAVTAAAVLMMFSSVFSLENINRPKADDMPKPSGFSETADGVREKINNFFDNFRKIEVFDFEKTEK